MTDEHNPFEPPPRQSVEVEIRGDALASPSILDAIWTMRRMFQRAGLQPPAMITLATHADGLNVLAQASERSCLVWKPDGGSWPSAPVMDEKGDAWMEFQVMGVTIRYPAQRRSVPGADVYF